jgi:UPF0755 protein
VTKDSKKSDKQSKIKAPVTKRIIFIFALALPILAFLVIDYFTVPTLDEKVERVPFIISKGASINAIADSLQIKGLIDDKELFILWLTTLDKDRMIKAGYYEIPKGLNYAQLITFLSQAPAKEMIVTLIEGWRKEEIAEELHKELDINKEKFMQRVHDSVYIKQLGIKAETLEGYLLPDTYHFYWGVNEQSVIDYLVNKCFEIFTDPIFVRLDSMKMTMHEVLTLASIIEGEAILDEEREIISSVYHNRLKRRIKLQADPTIQYILAGSPRRLLLKDLEVDSPYNTYKYYGLPPGPISNPGKKSILAAIFPAKTNYIFFVAKGDGSHTFSRSAAEHQRAKTQFDKIRREVSRQKRASNLKRDLQ